MSAGLLGTAGGLLTRSHPPLRLTYGILAGAAVIGAPAGRTAGALFVIAAALFTVLLTGPPAQVLRRALLFGGALYIPLLAILMVPVVFGFGDVEPGRAVVIAGVIALKGMATLLVTLSVVATLPPTELHAALGALPLPRTMRLVLIQIVHQTGILLEETTRITQVLRIRARGARGGWRVAASLPRAWLERIASRAGRTGDAMELRGYVNLPRVPFPALAEWRAADVTGVASGIVLLTAVVVLVLLS